MEFNPDYTPLQMFKQGVFGGTYFRPIKSGIKRGIISGPSKKVTEYLRNIPSHKLYLLDCDPSINKYKIKTGNSLKVWEEKGWIYPSGSSSDYYGWVGSVSYTHLTLPTTPYV